MRVHRGYLFWGIFFVLLGGIPLADREGWIDPGQVGIGRLWPLIVIAIGFTIVLSRSRIAVLGTVVTALILGTMAGSALAWSSGWVLGFGDCAGSGGPALAQTRQSGSFTDRASVALTSSCGSMDVTLTTGQDWTLQAGHRGAPPVIETSQTHLGVRSAEGSGRQEWDLALPSTMLDVLEVTADAGETTLGVGGATLSKLGLTLNAGNATIDAAGTSIANLDVTVNTGRAGIQLGGPVSGSITANAGKVDLCVPPDAPLRLDVSLNFAFETNLGESGLTHDGDIWQRTGTGGQPITITVEGNAAGFELDPSGGCR